MKGVGCRILCCLLGAIVCRVPALADNASERPRQAGGDVEGVDIVGRPAIGEDYGAAERFGLIERFRYDNDLWIARDDAFYSGGWGHEWYSPPLDGWVRRPDGEPRRALPLWIGKHVPGLRPSDRRLSRFGTGFFHTTQTPDDIRSGELQVADVPSAGALGVFWSWTTFDNRALNAFQIYTGILGEVAGAQEIHELIHEDLGRGPVAEGWRWQLHDEPLLNLNYALKRKIAGPKDDDYRGFQGDLAVALHQALGNYHTATDLQLEFRAGARLPAGFARIPDPIGQGIGMEPVVEVGGRADRGPRLRFSLVVRATGLWHSPFLDGNSFRSSPHPGIAYDPFFFTAIAGLHLDWGRFSAHLTYFGSGLAAELDPESRTSPSWLSLAFDLRHSPR